MSTKFTVRLRKQPTTANGLSQSKSDSSLSSRITNATTNTEPSGIQAKVAKLNVSCDENGFKRPVTQVNTSDSSTTSTTTTKFDRSKFRTRDEYIDSMLQTPPLPSPTTFTRPFDQLTGGVGGGQTNTATTTTRPLTTRGITDELNAGGQANFNSSSTNFTNDMFEQQRRAIAPNPIFEKFRNLRISTCNSVTEEEEVDTSPRADSPENNENTLPELLKFSKLCSQKALTPKSASKCSKSIQTPVSSARRRVRCEHKVVRSFSADQSVVEVLPENDPFEPHYVKGINNGVLQLPNSHQNIGGSAKSYTAEIDAAIASQAPSAVSSSTSKKPSARSSARKKQVSLQKKKLTTNSSTKKSSLVKYPGKDDPSSGKPGGRVLKPINLDPYMAAADSNVAQQRPQTLLEILGCVESPPCPSSSLSSASSALKSAQSCSSLANPAVAKPQISPQVTSVEDTYARLKHSNSMPDLGEKSSLSEHSKQPQADQQQSSVSSSSAVQPSLKSLRMIGRSVPPSVPKVRDIISSISKQPNKSSAQPSSSKKSTQPPPQPSTSTNNKSREVVYSIKKSNSNVCKQAPPQPTPKQSSSSSERTIMVKDKLYQVLNKIGRGGSSVVYVVFDQQEKRLVALKVVDLSRADNSVVIGFRDEIKLLSSLNTCKRVVRMFDYEFRKNKNQLLIIMEKGDDDLANVLKSFAEGSRVKPNVIRFYWEEMLTAVNEIHQRNVVHSDLKPVNFILVSGKLKLIDFGIANTIQSNKTSVYKDHIIGTVDFMAPESFQKKTQHNGKSMVKFNQKADIWSLGVILYNLVYGHTPFSQFKDNMGKGMAIINNPIDYPPIEDPLLLDVIQQCLQKDPTKRPTAAELLEHAYLTKHHTELSIGPSKSHSSSSESLNRMSTSANTSPSNSSKSSGQQSLSQMLSQVSQMTPKTRENFFKIAQSMSEK